MPSSSLSERGKDKNRPHQQLVMFLFTVWQNLDYISFWLLFMLYHLLCSAWYIHTVTSEPVMCIWSVIGHLVNKNEMDNMLTKAPNSVRRSSYKHEIFITQGNLLNLFLSVVMHVRGWEKLKTQYSLWYEKMIMLFVRIDAQKPVKLIAAAGRLTLEWCIEVEIGVANFQKQDDAIIQVSQKYIMQLEFQSLSTTSITSRENSLFRLNMKDDTISIIS